MDVEIRRARAAELAAAGRVTLEAYVDDGFLTADDDYAARLLDAADRDAGAELFVALDAGVVVGTVTFCPPGSSYRELAGVDEGEFRMLAVQPGARGRGVARRLVEQCFARCRELGLTSLVICSMTEMSGAHALYASHGFMREPTLDFSPVPGVELLAFRAPV